ncbi:semaphorin 5c isoform X4 [Rhodnius prolixus]|uniref:semaphorin 5c isoform X4 n=1 Tax=Rhodnius prolixus TaxID=13249 RepID=UPI003D18E03B
MALLLLLLLSITLTTAADVIDPRIIAHQDLMMSAVRFSDPTITGYSQLLFDISRNQVIVGARDSLFRLSLTGLELLEKAPWPAAATKVQLCQDKGQSENDCHNFIRVLLTNGKRLYSCGTSAFSPQCTWREMEDINRVLHWEKGIAKCPYSPHANVTSLLSVTTGQYFAGTPMDFSGADPAIIRDLGSTSNLRTNQYNSNWLNEPQFVGSFETDTHVYFLFRESAVEHINCGKIVYSRIARVCKNDNGGQVMLRDNWTTFVKARLNCSLPGEYPFYFDNIQGMTYLPDQALVYATFTTPTNSIPGSAICSFNMSAIETAFSGPFKHQASASSAWERSQVRPRHSTCSGTQTVLDSTKYQLMDSAIQPTSLDPLYHSRLETLLHIAVDTVATKMHKTVHVLYVSTVEGLIKKISVLDRTQKTCVLEIWKPFPPGAPVTKINTLQFAAGGVYIATDAGVTRVGREHCRRYKSRTACVNSMDPHCGWHDHQDLCVPAPDHNPLAPHWFHDATNCPTFDHAGTFIHTKTVEVQLHNVADSRESSVSTQSLDGGWSAWSSWTACKQATSIGYTSEPPDMCLCSHRTCDNPAPAHGGAPCTGLTTRVTNCTLHGGWTAWSSWSACSQTCGVAVKTRRRTCGAPAPQHGGRVCVGQDRVEMYCHQNPPCPPDVLRPVRDGGWSPWGPWSECTAKCGGGFRNRTRSCTNPPPQQPGGLDCAGCHIEYQTCNSVSCIESKRVSPWTQWTPSGNGSEKRYRFACKAPSQDPSLIKVTLFRVDERHCTPEGICTTDRLEGDEAWSEWSAWSPCSAECGTGQQIRTRMCEGNPHDCRGSSHITKPCNTHKCEWGCWSEWSPCSANCGTGTRHRSRNCIGGDESTCVGQSSQHEDCHVTSCYSLEGWEEWSLWSPCDETGHQTRTRVCSYSNPGTQYCQGTDTDLRVCADPINDEQSVAQAAMGIGTAIGCLVIGFLVGTVSSLLLRHFLDRRSHNRLPASPHYISSKQNPYVTVPLKETPASPKRTPSFSRQNSNNSANGSGVRLFKPSAPDYDTATIKRNSHALANGHIRADLHQQDKFF